MGTKRTFLGGTIDDSTSQRAGALAGVPIGLTDLIDLAGLPTTANSSILRNQVTDADAE